MSILLISDIHGNLPALCAVLEEARRLGGFGSILSLGDVVGYGCMPSACIDMLRDLDAIHLQGNHDWYVGNNQPCPRSRSANVSLSHHRRWLDEPRKAWLRSCPTIVETETMSCVHGNWSDPIDGYLETIEDAAFETQGKRLFASGHTHVPFLYRGASFTYVNPGSVGQPRDGDWRASFAIVDGEEVTLGRAEYDIDAMIAAMQDHGYDAPLYDHLRRGERIGGAITPPPKVVKSSAVRRGRRP